MVVSDMSILESSFPDLEGQRNIDTFDNAFFPEKEDLFVDEDDDDSSYYPSGSEQSDNEQSDDDDAYLSEYDLSEFVTDIKRDDDGDAIMDG